MPDRTDEGRTRRVLAAALLVVLAVSLAATVSPAELARRSGSFARSIIGEGPSAAKGSGFWFDPDYAAFLEAIRRRTPPDATIAIVAPASSDLYTYEAAYQLAPRWIVPAGQEGQAGWVAAYRYQYRDLKNPDVVQIPGGALFRRR